MHETTVSTKESAGLRTPVRNRYFYGKLLDVYHFELETNYVNAKRWLLNRLVSGYGVVCGLDVLPGREGNQILITPGVAIDKWGREIIVPRQLGPIAIPPELMPRPANEYEEQARHVKQEPEKEACVQVLICYHECESDPVPVLAGDCNTSEPCAPGTIRERYRVTFEEGCAQPYHAECRIPDVISGGRIDYAALAKWVSLPCPEPPRDPCILLANVRLPDPEEGHHCDPENIDITVRPIVYSNDLLFELLLAAVTEAPKQRQQWK